MQELQLIEHITLHANANLSSSGASHINIPPQFSNDYACRLLCQRWQCSSKVKFQGHFTN